VGDSSRRPIDTRPPVAALRRALEGLRTDEPDAAAELDALVQRLAAA
jgi:hypothetical protein